MTDIIEAGARAIAGNPSDKLWNAYHAHVQYRYREDARAAYVAMVGALSNDDMIDIIGAGMDYDSILFAEFRAALLKLVEVDDG